MKKSLQIGVIGTAVIDDNHYAFKVAEEVGLAIAKLGHSIVTGALDKIPYAAAKACKEAGGISLGISPAISPIEHKIKYANPTDDLTSIVYTGMGFYGRSVLLINSCDALIMINGRVGTLMELTVGIAKKIPIAILYGTGGFSDRSEDIFTNSGYDTSNLWFVDQNFNKEDLVTQLVQRSLSNDQSLDNLI